MDKYNIVFVENQWSQETMLGRRVGDYAIREFADFNAPDCRIAKIGAYKEDVALLEGYINVVLTLDMPLVKKGDIFALVRRMRAENIDCVGLGKNNPIAKICIGKSANKGVFSSDKAFFQIDDAKSYNVVYNLLKDAILDDFLSRGVRILDKNTTFIDDTINIESGVVILPYTRIEGESVLMNGAKVAGSYIKDSVIDGASVEYSYLACSHVHARATVGPFARLRGATIGNNCRVGDFVEVKASTLREGVKASHLTYIGDADVGERTNVGCGSVFCNYDGVDKHKTTVGCNCFIGANTNLIAPVVVGDNAFIAAGTTVTRDIEDGSFTIGRVRQDTKIKK